LSIAIDVRAAATPLGAAVAAGVGVGVATSFGQAHLGLPWLALCNSGSAWLVAPFLVGWLAHTRGAAAALGLATCMLEVVGYELASHLRGVPVNEAQMVFWSGCALVGGPAFGAAAHLRRTGRLGIRGLGGTFLAASFAAEGLWVYLRTLGYTSTAVLWFALAAAWLVLLARRPLELRWLPVTLVAGVAAEVAVAATYVHSFG
jgi:hypothetical protein